MASPLETLRDRKVMSPNSFGPRDPAPNSDAAMRVRSLSSHGQRILRRLTQDIVVARSVPLSTSSRERLENSPTKEQLRSELQELYRRSGRVLGEQQTQFEAAQAMVIEKSTSSASAPVQ